MCCYVKDSCQICIHSESKQMQKPEHLYISTIYRLQSFGKSFHIYHYLRNCSLVTRSGWMEKQHCTAQGFYQPINIQICSQETCFPPNPALPGVAGGGGGGGGPVPSYTNSSPLLRSRSTLTVYNLCRMYNFSLSVFLATT